jgi:rhodanese-related sulfurtransferase
MKPLSIICTLLVSLLWLNACQGQYPKAASCENAAFDKEVNSYLSYTVPVISVEKAYVDKRKYVFLDAREQAEYDISHIDGALAVGYDRFDAKSISKISKDQAIIVYCSIGYRSEKIATKLRKLGYTQVYNLYGSIFEWANRGYPLVNNQGRTTHLVHTYNAKWSKWLLNARYKKTY